MKKSVLLLMVAVATLQSLTAQNNTRNKKAWFDVQIAQHIGLNQWSTAGYVNDGLPATSITEIRGTFNLRIVKPFGGFVDMGIGVMPAPAMKSLDPDRMPMPYSGTQYYLRETLSESGDDKASAHFMMTAGLFADLRVTEKLNIVPYLGIGGFTMSHRSYEIILKEDGSNMQYNAKYEWKRRQSEEYSSSTLGYITGRLNFKCKISPKSKSSLLLGLEYTYFFDTMNFYGRFSNTFNGNIQRDFTVEGNRMNMFGVSVGLSFR